MGPASSAAKMEMYVDSYPVAAGLEVFGRRLGFLGGWRGRAGWLFLSSWLGWAFYLV
jgi:hypothetical protein